MLEIVQWFDSVGTPIYVGSRLTSSDYSWAMRSEYGRGITVLSLDDEKIELVREGIGNKSWTLTRHGMQDSHWILWEKVEK